MDYRSQNDALTAAVVANDCAGVRDLLSQGADPGAVLSVVAELGRTEILKLLIEAGVRVEADSELWAAVANGHWETAQALLAGGASIQSDLPFSNCGSILFAALGANPFLRLFLKMGADVNARIGPWGNTILFDAAEGPHRNLKILLEAGADPNARNNEGETVLMWAARKGAAGAVETLLKAGADPNVFNEQGNDEMGIASTALTGAILNGLWKSVLALLTGGADVNQPDTLGRTPLMLAVEFMPHLVGCLVAEGAYVSAIDREGRTIQQRVEANHRELIRQLGVDHA